MTKTLLSLGHGYCAAALAQCLVARGWHVMGTTRSPERAQEISATGVTPVLWEKSAVAAALSQATHVLASAAPQDGVGDPALALVADVITAQAARYDWVGYLSTTGVYGDHEGAWVDETTALTPGTDRGRARVAAERDWSAIPDLPLHIFRLAGIYGPGRGPFEKVRAGTARRIIKPGQVFSRIHVDDIAQALAASIDRPDAGAIYNLCDDDPAPPQDVLAHAAHLLGCPPPPEVDFETAQMSPMARSFYAESKRVRNDKMKQDLRVSLIHPTYRSGLKAMLNSQIAV